MDEERKEVLSLPVVFNSEIAVGNVWISPHLHAVLKEHNVLLLKPFLVNFVIIFETVNVVDPATATMIAQLR